MNGRRKPGPTATRAARGKDLRDNDLGTQAREGAPFLDDARWAAIARGLQGRIGVRVRNSGAKYRLFVEGVLWVVASDTVWNVLPARFGRWHSVYIKFRRWAEAGWWDCVIAELGKDSELGRALARRIDQHMAAAQRYRASRAP